MPREMLRENTTDLAAVRARPSLFTWGKVERIHDIGRYTLVEYYSPCYRGCAPTEEFEPTTRFHIYVDGESTSNGTRSLESALIYAVALGRLAADHARHMTAAVQKILEIE